MGLECYQSKVKGPNKQQKREVSSEGRLEFGFVGGRRARKCLLGSMLITFQPLCESSLTDSSRGEEEQSVAWAATATLSAQIVEQ